MFVRIAMIACIIWIFGSECTWAQEPQVERDLAYKPKGTDYERSRCKLDLYIPIGAKNFATLVWFHGGGLQNGDKAAAIALEVAKRFSKSGIAVASVNYRLSPQVTYPAYVEDAAAAVAFVHREVAARGGDRSRVFVSGHSAGAYLTSMLAVDSHYLEKNDLKPSDLAGYIPVSGQMITHATVRSERGIAKTKPMIDDAAPSWHVAASVPPMLCIWGDDDLPTRAEENQYFVSAMKVAGNNRIESLHVAARTHDTIASRIMEPDDIVASTMEKFIRINQSVSPTNRRLSTLSVRQTDAAITVADGERPILVYNKKSPPAPAGIDSVYERSGFIHPIHSPNGEVLSAAFPFDHPHQHGLFSAWVRTTYDGKPVDFWNLAQKSGLVRHERVTGTFEYNNAAGFEVDLIHRVASDPPVDVLREHWKLTAWPTDGTYRLLDLETTQRLIADKPLIIEKYHYGGFAFRGSTRWLLTGDADKDTGNKENVRETVAFINSEGQDRIAGNHAHARWVALSGQLNGNPSGIVILDHPENFRSPQASRLHPTKPYFCFAPCVDGEFTIDADYPYHARYRILVTDRLPDAEWIQAQWKRWAGK